MYHRYQTCLKLKIHTFYEKNVFNDDFSFFVSLLEQPITVLRLEFHKITSTIQ